jgi:SAM-dependent methyltransferase
MTNFKLDQIIAVSSHIEPYAGGDQNFDEKIKGSLPFLKLIDKKYNKILVIGCGEGYEVKWLAEQGFKAVGLTKNASEASNAYKKYRVKVKISDMHQLPFKDKSFDCIYASNVLEHSISPFIALKEWRRVLKLNGILVLVMPSKEWVREYYHFSVLTHWQTIDLLTKTGFELLAGPSIKPKIDYQGGDIYYNLGRGWGHYDGYVAEKLNLKAKKFMLGESNNQKQNKNQIVKFIKMIIKIPYNYLRKWYGRHHIE